MAATASTGERAQLAEMIYIRQLLETLLENQANILDALLTANLQREVLCREKK